MSYQNKEILRDKNNRPIPQIWSEEIDDFVPYTGNTQEIKAIKNDLVTIKNELQAIKANQLSGDAKVTLSGTIPPLVKIYERSFASHSGVEADHCYAENIKRSDSSGIIPLDVRNYKDGYVQYLNNTDQTRRFFIYSLFATSEGPAGVASSNYLESISMRPPLSISVPAGTTIYLSPKRYGDGESNVAELDLGCVGFAFRLIWASQSDVTTGTETLIAIFK